MSLKCRSTGASYVRSTRSNDNSGQGCSFSSAAIAAAATVVVAAAAVANLGGSLCKSEAARYISDAPLKRPPWSGVSSVCNCSVPAYSPAFRSYAGYILSPLATSD